MQFFFSPVVRIRRRAEKRLERITPQSTDFYVLIALSSALAALGLLMDNTSVIIGAMVLAPLVTPLFTFSLSLLILRVSQVYRSALSIFFGTLCAVGVAAVIGSMVHVLSPEGLHVTQEMMDRAQPNTLYFLVAVLSGVAGTIAYARPKITEFVTGVAIAAALIPPVAVAGLGLAISNMFLFRQSMLLYVFNIVGICFGSMLTFIVLGFGNDVDAPHT